MNASSKKRLDFSARAEREYLESIAYIAEDSLVNAALVQGRIGNALELLINFPMMGAKGRMPGTREYAVPNTSHTLVYRVTAEAIRIGHVMHQRRAYFNR